jgi:signal transduction histidine kinase
MTDPTPMQAPRPPQTRPIVAKWLSLRIRLGVLVALVVTLVVGVSSYLQVRVFEATVLADLLETARLTAQAVADDVELRPDPLDIEDLADGLREFNEAFPSIRGISVVVMDSDQPTVLTSTSTAERPQAVGLAAAAIRRKDMVWSSENEALRSVAVPANRDERLFGAVVLTFSLASVTELHKRGRLIVFWFVPAAIIVLTLLVDLLVRRLIHAPIAGMQHTMHRVGAGDLSARAPVVRRDEIGAVAQGLNEMLATMQNFNVALQERVREATEELRTRNAELVDSYSRVLALREALGRAEQMAAVGHMAASVAHQIGTPLNLISGYVQVVMQDEGPDSHVARRLQIVQEQINRVTSIVRTMLDHARRPSPRQPTDIAELVDRVCTVARPKLDALGVTLDLDLAADVPLVQADPVQLELALLNLITNSLDAMPSGGSLSISVSESPTGARVRVVDTGVGIAPELLPRIFDAWVTTKAAGHGTGLGLSITRDAITGHGGTIAVESEPGRGAVFTIELPGVPQPATAAMSNE